VESGEHREIEEFLLEAGFMLVESMEIEEERGLILLDEVAIGSFGGEVVKMFKAVGRFIILDLAEGGRAL
jgi:hypothetical protein